MKSRGFLVAFCARLKTYGALFGDKNHKAFSRFCLCGHEKSGIELNASSVNATSRFTGGKWTITDNATNIVVVEISV